MKPLEPEAIPDNVIKLIGSDWMLITAGTIEDFNTMTASAGGFGVLFKRRKICFCAVKPSHHTYRYMEKAAYFTLSFFEEAYRSVLKYCGSTSGRDVDKVSATGITPVQGRFGDVYFAEARLVLECKKIYFHDINPDHFVDPALHDRYPDRDYHRVYMGEIVGCLAA